MIRLLDILDITVPATTHTTELMEQMIQSILTLGVNLQPIIIECEGDTYTVIANHLIAHAVHEAHRQNDNIELCNAIIVTPSTRDAILAQFA